MTARGKPPVCWMMLARYDKFPVLHVWVHGAEDVAVDPKYSRLIRHERDFEGLARHYSDALVEVMLDGEAMRYVSIVAADINVNLLALTHLDYRPRSIRSLLKMVDTVIEP